MIHPGDNRIAAFPQNPGDSGVCPTALSKPVLSSAPGEADGLKPVLTSASAEAEGRSLTAAAS
jgi:hypothetical protein